jgi:hypothetical protein
MTTIFNWRYWVDSLKAFINKIRAINIFTNRIAIKFAQKTLLRRASLSKFQMGYF